MILGPVNMVDCGVLAFFLVTQVIIQVGILPLIIPLIKIIPLIAVCLPLDVLRERFLLSRKQRPQFARDAGLFEYLVVRFVKYSFKHLPQKVARVLFTKQVAIPVLRWRMLRHGYLRYPVHVEHCTINDSDIKIQGTWIREDPDRDPDFVLYYIHGGGFALGSSYFYLEFLLTWHHLLKERGFKNPAIFAIDYTLAPDDTYPTQVLETLQGYRHVIKVAKDTSKVCVGGDSAGGALTLSLLLELAAQGGKLQMRPGRESHPIKLALPHMAILISPWVTLVSSLHKDSDVDYLDRDRLWEYAHEYVEKAKVNVSPASPGSCTDERLWRLCQPKAGYFVVYSGVEMLAEDARNFVKQQRKHGADVEELDYDGGVHAWPVVCMTTASTRERRLRGVKAMVEAIRARF